MSEDKECAEEESLNELQKFVLEAASEDFVAKLVEAAKVKAEKLYEESAVMPMTLAVVGLDLSMKRLVVSFQLDPRTREEQYWQVSEAARFLSKKKFACFAAVLTGEVFTVDIKKKITQPVSEMSNAKTAIVIEVLSPVHKDGVVAINYVENGRLTKWQTARLVDEGLLDHFFVEHANALARDHDLDVDEIMKDE